MNKKKAKSGNPAGIYDWRVLLVLPFRGHVAPLRSRHCFQSDSWETEIALYYQDQLDGLGQLFGPESESLDTTSCTYVELLTKFPWNGDLSSARAYLKDSHNATRAVEERVLPRLNALILQLKLSAPYVTLTGTMRSVGDIDVVYQELALAGERVFRRISPRVDATLSGDVAIDHIDWDQPTTLEWKFLQRAVDLVNHGYPTEALLIGFALLDQTTQSFLKSQLEVRIPDGDAQRLLRMIERSRLSTYLGPLCRLVVGSSPLDNPVSEKELQWLNNTRNTAIHTGQECTSAEARRALRYIVQVLKFLNEFQGYLFPEKLQFWTDRDT